MNKAWNVNTHNEKKVQKTRIYISISLATIGLLVILSQTIPLAKSYVDGLVEQLRADMKVNPVPESYKEYIEKEFAYYNPGKSYFANLSEKIDVLGEYSYDPNSKTQKEVIVDTEYKKDMYITIEDIEINNIKISPNVESSEESIYNQYLKDGVAHFKGTPLPGDGGNSFIYGHSAVESFFSRHKNLPETIFSKLDGIDIGQKIVVTKDDKVLEYIVRNKKIVDPEDFTILQPVNDKETVTLMTCWPLGVGTKRLVVVAERRI